MQSAAPQGSVPPASRLSSLINFGLWGVGINAVALGLNAGCVELLGMPTAPAYALVLAWVILAGYLANRFVVFRRTAADKDGTLGVYTLAVLLIRGSDWLLYTVMTGWLGAPYLAAQVCNIFLFFGVKYYVLRHVLSGAPARGRV